jgi:hypothetical protein
VNAATYDANRRPGGLNFWQWLGIVIIVVGVAFYLWRNFTREEEPPQQIDQPAPTQAEGSAEQADDAQSAE